MENVRQGWRMPPMFWRAEQRVRRGGFDVRLWVVERKLPYFMAGAAFVTRHQALLVPVATDLNMVFGIAKMARDYGADIVQREAERAAPLPPGEAFVGTGARYRYDFTVLAVIFDDLKRTSPDIIARAVKRGAQLASQRGCTGLILPDMTENLLAQPNWISQEQREQTADAAAMATIQAIRACRGMMDRYHIWCWDPRNAPAFRRELQKL